MCYYDEHNVYFFCGIMGDLNLNSLCWNNSFGKKVVPMKTVHSEICGLFSITVRMFLERPISLIEIHFFSSFGGG